MKTDHRPLFPRRRAKRESRFSFRFLSALWCFWLFVAPRGAAQTYRVALPNYHYAFPRDHFSHPAYQTEWWYYTGNLTALDGRRFGFELTFFRQGVSREPAASPWDLRDVYVAHLALSDLSNGHFYHLERVNRAGPGLAGAEESASRIWNGNWQILWKGSEQQLQAIAENFELHFTLHSEKPPVIHGENGVSQKAAGPGQASHYYSLTRLDAQGTILLGGRSFPVSGLAWMDHEFFTHQMTAEQTGWDWFSLRLDNRSELMLFRIRRKDGSIDPFSNAEEHQLAAVVELKAEPIPAGLFGGHLVGEEFVVHPGQPGDRKGSPAEKNGSLRIEPRQRIVMRSLPRAGGFLANAIFAVNNRWFFRMQREVQLEVFRDGLQLLF